MSNQNVVLPNPSSGVGSNQFSQRQSSRCNNKSIHSFMEFQPQSLSKKQVKGCDSRDELEWKCQLKLKRENGLTFKALMNGVSPNNQQQNGNSFNHTKEKVFHSFQQNNLNGQPASNPAELGSQGFLQNQNGVGNSQEVEIKALNGFLPMVNSQQLMTSNNIGIQQQQQRPVGLMAAKAHMQDPALGQSGLTFGDNEYKNYPATHQIQKQLVNQNSDNQVVAGQSQHHANSVKLDKQMKLEMKQQSMHYQANHVNGFNSSTREGASNSGQGVKRPAAEDKLSAQNNQLGVTSNNQRSTQRRKLLFEYGLEKNFSNGNTTNGSGSFPLNSDPNAQGYNSKQAGQNPPANLKNMSGQAAQMQGQRYGAQNFGGAVKGSSLGHYQQLQANAAAGGGNQTHQRTPEGISNASGNSGVLASNGTVPNSASQQSASLKSGAQPTVALKDKPSLVQNSTSNTTEMSRSVNNRNVQGEQQSSKGNLAQPHYIPSIAAGHTGQNNQLSNSVQRKQQYQNQMSSHKSQNSVTSMGLLEQLLLNLKAINIEKLDEKEQEQLRFLSNQYQYHLTQFQEYQKQQILSGTFESAIGLGASGNQATQGLNSSGKTQSTIRYNNNQSGFSGRLNDQVSVSNQNGAKSNGSGLGDIQGKSQLQLTEQKHIEGESLTQGQGHIKQQSASVTNNAAGGFNNVYSSQERFVQNEKNLKDMRLKKSKQRNENTPGQSVATTEQNGTKPFGSSVNNTGTGGITSDLSGGSPFFKESSKEQDNSKSSIMNSQGIAQVNSHKNLNRNISYGKVNDKTYDMSATGATDSSIKDAKFQKPGPKTSTIGDLPFSFHLNLPHPVPQITSTDIKGLTANQRCAIFKHLQKREKSKFLGIQQNKMKTQEKQVQIKFTQQRFRSKQLGAGVVGGPLNSVFDKGSRDRTGYIGNESRAGGMSVGGSGTGARTGMSRFVSVGQRGQRDHNGRLNNMESDMASQAQFDKQMENLRRQWASDLRAFGIFQQNELWQFSQMNDSQQKQILVCNLQQGKFQSLIDEQYEMLMQKQAQQAWINERNTLLQRVDNSTKPTTNRDGAVQDAEDQQKQRRHTYGSALSSIGKDGQESKDKDDAVNQVDQSNPSKQQSFRNSINFDSNTKDNQVQSLSEADKDHSDQNTDEQRSASPQKRQIMNSNLIDSLGSGQKSTTGEDASKKEVSQFNTEREKTININFKEFEKKTSQLTNINNNQPQQDVEKTHPGLGIGLKDKQENNNTHQAKSILNPIQKRYEDSKDSFQECLRLILCRYQSQINLSHIQGNQIGHGNINDMNSQGKIGIENLLPNFTRNLMNKNYKDGMMNGDMGSLKHRQSESAKNNFQNMNGKGNLNTISNDKYGIKSGQKGKPGEQPATNTKSNFNKLKVNEKVTDPKKKDQTIVAPNSTKSGAKKIGIDGKEVECDGEAEGEEPKEAVVEEVKKPRYFPPKRLPNPFESAAQEQERFIQARKDALIKYSNISKNRYKQDEKEPLKYVIRPGNNSKLIMRVLEQSGRIEPRYDKNDPDVIVFPGWEPADDYFDSLYHFKWKPTSNGIKYDMISKHGLKQVVNHVRGHGTLTTKDQLFLNLKQYYEQQKLNIFETVPITIVLDYLKDDIGQKVEQVQNVINIIDKNLEKDSEHINKKLIEMQQQKEKSVKTPYKISPCCHNKQNLWLLKPTGFNRGIGIHLFQNFDQLRDIMSNYYGIGRGARDKASIFQQHNQNHNPNSQAHPYADPNAKDQEKMKNFTFVIQKLVERPMLYFNRKFDIRQWVLLNAADGRVYIYRESYVRTSSREYVEYDPQLPEEDQIYMQLTNNAVQKVGNDYEKYEEGNIVSVHTLFEYIAGQPEAKGRGKEELELKYKSDIEKMIIETIKAVKGQIMCQKNTFELLGYDFILDEDLNTYLIEVNTNPCLEESNELLRKLLPRMIDDTLNHVMDPVFITPDQQGKNFEKYKSKFALRPEMFSVENNQKGKVSSGNLIQETTKHEGYKDDVNLWKHITNLE